MTDQAERSAAAPSATPPGPAVAPTRVSVRMYRALKSMPPGSGDYQGLLGDCFLIRLEGEAGGKGTSAHILIDCGMLLGSPDAVQRMQAIAGDIVEACGGKLDLLVVTHEHWDHISGFFQAYDIFSSKLRIDKVWMAWTEKLDDPQALALRKRFDKAGTTFAMVAGRLKDEASRFGAQASSRALQGLEGFLGEVSDSAGAQGPAAGLGAAAGAAPKRAAPRLAGRDILDRIKTWGATEYREPGEVLWTPGDVSVRAFVLGPPRDEKKLFKDKPSSGPAQETYFDHLSVDADRVHGFAEREDPDPASVSPFAARYCRIDAKDLEGRLARKAARGGAPFDAREWLCARYNGTEGMADAARDGMDRRRIDLDWLDAAGAMALKLDSDTNNTSLVLAFELPDDTVMLFAADAQVGNWLSWHDRDYPAGDGTRVTAEQLLNRTRFYKVGHHGSHNATLHEKGLAMMTRSDLVAAIPTDEVLGKAQGGSGWLMPNPRVNTALRERTAGKIMRNDRVYSQAARDAPGSELAGVTQDFFDRLTEEELYLEYRLLP